MARPVVLSAVRNGKRTANEVRLALTLDEAWEIGRIWQVTGRLDTLALGGADRLPMNTIVWEGLPGDVIHAEAPYMRDLRLVRFDPDREPWRPASSIRRNGNPYLHPPLGAIIPVPEINHSDRFDLLVSMNSTVGVPKQFSAG